MYPFLRMFKEMARVRRLPPLGLFETHVSHHLCWPRDLGPWVELNNGRTLTLYDLGRLPLGHRTGIHHVLKAQGDNPFAAHGLKPLPWVGRKFSLY